MVAVNRLSDESLVMLDEAVSRVWVVSGFAWPDEALSLDRNTVLEDISQNANRLRRIHMAKVVQLQRSKEPSKEGACLTSILSPIPPCRQFNLAAQIFGGR